MLHEVSRTYDERSSIRDVSFEIYPGELVVLIGHGSAGKTDLLRLILGLSHVESGELRVFGHDPGSSEALQHVGVVLDTVDFPSTMKTEEIIELVRAHFADPAPTDELVQRCGLEDQIGKAIADLNNSQRRWLAILLSLVNNPRALVMDTPMLGMDVRWRRDFWELLTGYTSDGGAALITSDVLHEVETYANRVIILHSGAVIASGTVSEILTEFGQRTMSMKSDSVPDTEQVTDVEWGEDGPRLQTADSDAVVQAIQDQHVDVEGLEVQRPRLEDVVLSLIHREEAGQS